MFIELNLLNPGTLLRLPLNGINVVLLLFCIIPTFKNWKKNYFFNPVYVIFCFIVFGRKYISKCRNPNVYCYCTYITFLDCIYYSKNCKNKF